MIRVDEHKADIEKKNYEKVVPRHCTHNHYIDPNKIKILDVEINTSKRLISEMINIHLQELPINLKEDTLGLHDSYHSVLHSPKHKNISNRIFIIIAIPEINVIP